MTDKVDTALDAIRLASSMSHDFYGKPLVICYSGGKDSDAILQLALESGVDFEVNHSHTTVDAPETVRHVRETFSTLEDAGVKCDVSMPTYKGVRVSMWSLIPIKRMPPTRLVRYCCDVLKESSCTDRLKVFGVRACESRARAERKSFEVIAANKKAAGHWELSHAAEVYEDSKHLPDVYDCNLISRMKSHGSTCVNPIIDWTETDVLDYLRSRKVGLNPLYERGYNRVGCIMCPMAGRNGRLKEAAVYPKYKDAYMRSFEHMLREREQDFARNGKPQKTCTSGGWKTQRSRDK